MRKIIVIAAAFVIFLSVIFMMRSGVYSSFTGFLDDPFRIDRETEFGNMALDAIPLTNDTKFRIEKISGDDLSLTMYYEKYLCYELLKNIQSYKKIYGKYFIISDEGYAIVIPNSQHSYLYICVDEDEYVLYSGSVDTNGNKIYNSRFVEDENIEYLDSYNEFSKEERAVFEKMRRG